MTKKAKAIKPAKKDASLRAQNPNIGLRAKATGKKFWTTTKVTK
jgi:hypothetical protein